MKFFTKRFQEEVRITTKNAGLIPTIDIFGIELEWNLFFQIIALGAATLFYIRISMELRLPSVFTRYSFFLTVVVVGFIGAKTLSWLEIILLQYKMGKDVSLIGNPNLYSGFRWPGFLIAVMMLLVIVKACYQKHNIGRIADVTFLTLAIVQIIGPIGCQFSGHGCYGNPTSLPWGMSYPYGSPATFIAVHPTPLYRVAYNLLVFGILFVLYRQSPFKRPGKTALLYLTFASLMPIFLEFIRRNDKMLLCFSFVQMIYMLLFCISASLLFCMKLSGTNTPQPK